MTRQIVLSDLYKEKYCALLQYFFNEQFNYVIFYLNLFHNITVLVTMSVFFFLVCSNEQLTIVLPFGFYGFFSSFVGGRISVKYIVYIFSEKYL